MDALLELAQKSWPERDDGDPATPFRVEQRLSEAQLEQLVADYQAGMTGRQLAERYGLARSTVIELLKERGVEVRHPRISQADKDRAAELYRQGARQIDIAQQLGRSKSVIWHLLRREGLV